VYVGALTLDVLLGDVRSLKQKRSAVAAIIAEVRRRQPGVAVAETGIELILETRDEAHAHEIVELVRSSGYPVTRMR